MKITYIAHSAFLLSDGENIVAIDPFITGNPNATLEISNVKPNFIVLTHGHGDHVGDAIQLAKDNNSTIITINELAIWLSNQGVNAHPMHIGGGYNFPFGRVKLTIAHHGSCTPDGQYAGNPCGSIIEIGGRKIYHTGDTGLFLDMKLIGELNKPDVMMLPIGDNFTMGIDDAVMAVDFVKPKLSIPMHYNTFPIIHTNPQEFADKVMRNGGNAKVMNYGETIEI